MWKVSVVALIAALGMSAPMARAEPVACADNASVARANEAFEAFCARCHNSGELARAYFAGAGTDEAQRREQQLAAFLDRHSSCPQRHHEEIASWLRQLSDAK